MSDLTTFRDHCRQMADAIHKPECRLWVERPGIFHPSGDWKYPSPECVGCISDADRALFALLAAEVDDYLAPQPDLFGAESIEPTTVRS